MQLRLTGTMAKARIRVAAARHGHDGGIVPSVNLRVTCGLYHMLMIK